MKTVRFSLVGALAALLLTLIFTPVFADEDLAKAVQNPVGSLISVPFKFNLDFGAENGEVLVVNLQPV